MKTKLLAISLLLFTSQVFGEKSKILQEDFITDRDFVLRIICIDGYKYLSTSRSPEISTIQMFEERDGKSLPVRCN